MSIPSETSLKDKIRSVAKEQNRPFNVVWRSLVLERFLARIATSKHRSIFIFKGGMLLAQYLTLGRETTDLDFLLHNQKATLEKLTEILNEISALDLKDSFTFEVTKLEVIDHLLTKYPGFAAALSGKCGNSVTRVSIDIGVGGWVETQDKEIALSATAKGPLFESEISLSVYPIEMIFAEKLQTSCFRGPDNSRMKDYHDLWMIMRTYDKIDANKLSLVIKNVFQDRETPVSMLPIFPDIELERLQQLWVRHVSALPEAIGSTLPVKIGDLIVQVNEWLKGKASVFN